MLFCEYYEIFKNAFFCRKSMKLFIHLSEVCRIAVKCFSQENTCTGESKYNYRSATLVSSPGVFRQLSEIFNSNFFNTYNMERHSCLQWYVSHYTMMCIYSRIYSKCIRMVSKCIRTISNCSRMIFYLYKIQNLFLCFQNKFKRF